MHPSRYPTDASRVGLVGTLLSGSALAWFALLLDKESPLLNNFEEFLSEFKACFGDTDIIRTAINKIQRLRQGDRPASAYAADFRLLASDIPWDDQALTEQFRYMVYVTMSKIYSWPSPKNQSRWRKQSVARWDATTVFSNDARNVSSKCQGQDQSPPMPQ